MNEARLYAASSPCRGSCAQQTCSLHPRMTCGCGVHVLQSVPVSKSSSLHCHATLIALTPQPAGSTCFTNLCGASIMTRGMLLWT